MLGRIEDLFATPLGKHVIGSPEFCEYKFQDYFTADFWKVCPRRCPDEHCSAPLVISRARHSRGVFTLTLPCAPMQWLRRTTRYRPNSRSRRRRATSTPASWWSIPRPGVKRKRQRCECRKRPTEHHTLAHIPARVAACMSTVGECCVSIRCWVAADRGTLSSQELLRWMKVQKASSVPLYTLGSLPPFLLVFAGQVASIGKAWNEHDLGCNCGVIPVPSKVTPRLL